MKSIFGVDHRATPNQKALDVPGIASARIFRRDDGVVCGTVHDEQIGQVYELRQVRFGWIVLDEWCVEHFGLTVRIAILKARAANK